MSAHDSTALLFQLHLLNVFMAMGLLLACGTVIAHGRWVARFVAGGVLGAALPLLLYNAYVIGFPKPL